MKRKPARHLLRLLILDLHEARIRHESEIAKKDELIAAKDERIAKLQHDLMAIPHALNLQRQLTETKQEVEDLVLQLNQEIGAKNAALKELEQLKRERQQ